MNDGASRRLHPKSEDPQGRASNLPKSGAKPKKSLWVRPRALAPLWLAGAVAPLLDRRLATVRFLALAFVLTTAFHYCERGTNYYLFPVYPTMFSIGAVTCVRLTRWILRLWVGAALTVSGLLLPVVLPILDPPLLQRYMEITRTKPRPFQAASIGAPLTQGFFDELGWRHGEVCRGRVSRTLA